MRQLYILTFGLLIFFFVSCSDKKISETESGVSIDNSTGPGWIPWTLGDTTGPSTIFLYGTISFDSLRLNDILLSDINSKNAKEYFGKPDSIKSIYVCDEYPDDKLTYNNLLYYGKSDLTFDEDSLYLVDIDIEDNHFRLNKEFSVGQRIENLLINDKPVKLSELLRQKQYGGIRKNIMLHLRSTDKVIQINFEDGAIKYVAKYLDCDYGNN